MEFKTQNRTNIVKQVFEQKRKSISRKVEGRIEEVFRGSERSMWLNRVLRPDDDSFDDFMMGFRKGLAVQLLPLWKDGVYQLKIKLNDRPLRDHLLNFLSAPVRRKSYVNA